MNKARSIGGTVRSTSMAVIAATACIAIVCMAIVGMAMVWGAPPAASSAPVPPLPPDWVPPAGSLQRPVDGPVIDGFRQDHGPYGPANRGLEFDPDAGAAVQVAAPGVVRFVGNVAGRTVVSVRHSSRTVSNYSHLLVGSPHGRVLVQGDVVSDGEVLGLASIGFHFSVLIDGKHVDPAPLLEQLGAAPRLIAGAGPPQNQARAGGRLPSQAASGGLLRGGLHGNSTVTTSRRPVAGLGPDLTGWG